MTHTDLAIDTRLTLDVGNAAAGGEAVARVDGRVVFVSGALPGERVTVRVTEVRKALARAEVVDVHEPSPHRVDDRRIALGAAGVGGMEYAHVDLPHSRELKEAAAADQFRRIGGLDLTPRVLPAAHEAPATAADPTAGLDWRTRVQLAVDAEGTVGMHATGSHRVVPVELVPFAVPEIEMLGLHHLSLPGADRLEIAVAADRAGEYASGAVIVDGTPEAESRTTLRHAVEAAGPGWHLLVREPDPSRRPRRGARRGQSARGGRNRGGAGARTVLRPVLGDGLLTEHVAGIDTPFRVRADGFWQVHRDAARELSARVVEETTGARRVLDLYCGVGLFSLAVSGAHGVSVTGIEGSDAAIESAEVNAEAAGVLADFTTARIEKLESLPEADTVVLDPPRAGAGAAVTRLLADSAAERIVYVSCDGATFARDAAALVGSGFRLEKTAAHDYFPLTAHTEFLSVFTR
ncbi:class I SAM-dependent RNA methyltransferase [Brevibacterium litoralis]|uniref:class I SAM-dependent RNA methyltransferase n=1 Tax=Brevibacterium litoralis TaxID=3138935 RepID=UPI0032ECB2DC